jgi:hypothetical protein
MLTKGALLIGGFVAGLATWPVVSLRTSDDGDAEDSAVAEPALIAL